jgi:threonine dehydrogenase-like Zn-dependent dehydrogenase
VLIVDNVPYRLEYARRVVPKVETVDTSSKNDPAEKQILALCRDEPAGAPDAVIECVGMHYANSFIHQFEMTVGLETDSPEALNSALVSVKKGGRVGVIGAYGGFCNHFNIGALMEKGLHIGTGQTPVHKYWKDLLEKVKRGELDPSIVVTHRLPLTQAAEAYQIFNDKQDNVIKVILSPSRIHESAQTIA